MRFDAAREPVAGMSDLLRSQQVQSVLDGVGGRIQAAARAIAPRDSGKYADGIEVQDGGLVRIGRYERTSVLVVATEKYSASIEAGHERTTRTGKTVAVPGQQILYRATEAVSHGA